MNEVELLVHGREVTLEQQKAVHARVIWYVPCTYINILSFKSPVMLNARSVDVGLFQLPTKLQSWLKPPKLVSL